MKSIITIVGGIIGSFVLVLLLGLGALYMKPDLFVSIPPGSVKTADSLRVKPDSLQKTFHDSTHIAHADLTPVKEPVAGPDTLLVSRLTERARILELVVDSLKKHAQVVPAKADSVPRSDWKATAKLIESMSPEDASKVLKQMSDPEVKQVIAKVKAKQAGKILANLEPDRVARIIR